MIKVTFLCHVSALQFVIVMRHGGTGSIEMWLYGEESPDESKAVEVWELQRQMVQTDKNLVVLLWWKTWGNVSWKTPAV